MISAAFPEGLFVHLNLRKSGDESEGPHSQKVRGSLGVGHLSAWRVAGGTESGAGANGGTQLPARTALHTMNFLTTTWGGERGGTVAGDLGHVMESFRISVSLSAKREEEYVPGPCMHGCHEFQITSIFLGGKP